MIFNWNSLGHVYDPTKINKPSFMKTHAQCPSVLIFDDYIKVYFSCRPEPINGQYLSYTTWLDLDRKDVTKIVRIATKPVMDLGKLGTFDEHAIYPTSFIKHNDNILMYYAGWHRRASIPYSTSIGLAISKDGENFYRYSEGPIIGTSEINPYEVSGPKIRYYNDKFYLFYIAGEGWVNYDNKAESIYRLKSCVSDNGVDFVHLNDNLIHKVLDDECQAGPDVFYKEGRYNMFFSYRYGLNFRNAERGYRIGYAFSDDLEHWKRDDSAFTITSNFDFDKEMRHYPHVFELDGNWYMIYNGNDFGRYGFGIAKLKK